ncbi:hypothetical protein Bbelb_375930 [Branchiostoma belcheri]|nr:hypothetical protein Bbelb_375930 [Branchiostoma belcheri]
MSGLEPGSLSPEFRTLPLRHTTPPNPPLLAPTAAIVCLPPYRRPTIAREQINQARPPSRRPAAQCRESCRHGCWGYRARPSGPVAPGPAPASRSLVEATRARRLDSRSVPGVLYPETFLIQKHALARFWIVHAHPERGQNQITCYLEPSSCTHPPLCPPPPPGGAYQAGFGAARLIPPPLPAGRIRADLAPLKRIRGKVAERGNLISRAVPPPINAYLPLRSIPALLRGDLGTCPAPGFTAGSGQAVSTRGGLLYGETTSIK